MRRLLALIPLLTLAVTESYRSAAFGMEIKVDAQESGVITEDFWRRGQELVFDQVQLLDRLTLALTTPNFQQLDEAELQLLRNDIQINNFLTTQNRNPQAICQGFELDSQLNNSGVNESINLSGLSNEQQQVYCTLYASKQQLLTLQPVLNRRLALLRLRTNPVGGNIPVGTAQFNIPTATFSAPNNAARLPELGSVVVGSPEKLEVANFRPPLLPAIAPASELQRIASSLRQDLLAVTNVFPENIVFPPSFLEGITPGRYDVLPEELFRYRDFLQQPDTGIIRLLPAALRPQPSSQIQSRLQTTIAQEFPFASVVAIGDSVATARLALDIDANGNLQIAQPGIDYGFILNLGSVPLEEVTSPELRQRSNQGSNFSNQPAYNFFFSYAPPTRLEELQVDRRRFLTGKVDNFAPEGLRSARVPLVFNQTYLVRLIQFQLPAALLDRQVISRRDRRYLDQLLEVPSSDVVVALQPVVQHSDGSYTVIWRLVREFSRPEVIDLASYLDLE
jgi:hypothetical protein